MLNDAGVPHRYREYTRDPLTADELRELLRKLGLGAAAVLRKRGAMDLGLHGGETEDELIALMARHPSLLERPIGVLGDRAVVGRPPERLLSL